MSNCDKPILILLAEDFHADTDVILRELKDSEMVFEHRISTSEDEFRSLMVTFNPDVILSPYSLRETNALKLLKIARACDVYSPFILLAFDLSEDIAIELLSEGIEDYITRSTLKRVSVSIKKALQRYKTELELRISESLYKEAQHIAKLGSWYMDSPDAELQWSDEMYAIHGMEPGPVDVEKVRNLTLPEDHQMFDSLTQRLFDGEDTSMVYRIRVSQTNDLKYLLANGKVTKNQAGEIISLSGTVQDISDRIVTQLELERIQDSLIQAQRIAKIGSWEWDVGAESIWWSEEMYRIYDITSDTVPTIALVRSFVHPDDKKRVEKLTSTDLDEGMVPVFEYRIKLKSDEVKHVISSAKQVYDDTGKVVRLIGTLQDVTQQALINERLQTLSLVASETINGVGIHDSKGRIVWVNKGFTRITGFELEDVMGKEPWEVVSSDQTNQKLVEMSYEKVMTGKPFSSDNVLRRKDGETVWVNVTYTPVLDDEGNISKIISIGTDITKQKEMEQLQKITLERLKNSLK